MTAERLRAAATTLRERAEAATPGPWTANVLGSEGYDIRAENHHPLRRLRVARCGYESWEVDKSNAAYIAMMSPPVASALADWLDWFANHAETNGWNTGHAAAVADALLGTTP